MNGTVERVERNCPMKQKNRQKGCHKIDKKWKNHKFEKEFMIFFGKWKKVVIKQ